MAAIYNEIELEWGGETWKVTPTYAMIQQIEQKVSIAGVSGRIANGEPPMSHIAFIVASLLRAAGCKDVSPDDVYATMTTTMSGEQFAALAALVISGFVPQREPAGNAGAPGKGAVSSGGAPTA